MGAGRAPRRNKRPGGANRQMPPKRVGLVRGTALVVRAVRAAASHFRSKAANCHLGKKIERDKGGQSWD